MTAEIAILNREAVALASDSAATIATEPISKIFPSANKIFTLSKFCPVGIMIYGNASFMGIPWETIIKIYRNKLSENESSHLGDYAKAFLDFLDNGNPLFPETVQDAHVSETAHAYFNLIKEQIENKVNQKIEDSDMIDKKGIKSIVEEILNNHAEVWDRSNNIPNIPAKFFDEVSTKYKTIINTAFDDTFEKLPLSQKNSALIKKFSVYCLTKLSAALTNEKRSGIVVAGFGKDDVFPAVMSYDLETILNNRLKYREGTTGKIDFKNGAAVIPFAQSEMVSTFMDGIDPKYREIIESYVENVFMEYSKIMVNKLKNYTDMEKTELEKKFVEASQKIVEDLSVKLTKYQRAYHSSPIVDIVAILPKDELAAMAESLVNLTSFKRRVTPESETVGGPIDVAVITKGDGFIWIKRKHYFKAELNPQFRENYYRGCTKYE
ncbi:Uncharacterised protein [uncultured archaeon]|nr:Uncharacterised protein [uncultured archaeon]